MIKTIEVGFPGGKRVDAIIDDRTIQTDQRAENGGEGAAPEPFELFLASIATSAGIYAHGFCQARDIGTVGLGLTMSCEKDLEAKLYKKISLKLTLPEGFPTEHEAAIKRAMDLCAVKKHIMNAPEFEIVTS